MSDIIQHAAGLKALMDMRQRAEALQADKARLEARVAELEVVIDIAIKLACPSCAEGYPTDKTWEHGNSDDIDRKGLYHPDRNYSGTAFGGGYHRCKAWKARAALSASPDSVREADHIGDADKLLIEVVEDSDFFEMRLDLHRKVMQAREIICPVKRAGSPDPVREAE